MILSPLLAAATYITAGPAPGATDLVWDTSFSGTPGTNYAYTNSNRTIARVSGSYYKARASTTFARSTGKRYAEFLVVVSGAAASNGGIMGVIDTTDTGGAGYVGDLTTKESVADQSNRTGPVPLTIYKNVFNADGVHSSSIPVLAGDILGVAVDFANKKVWFYRNGVCASGDAVTNTGGRVFSGTPSFVPAGSGQAGETWTFPLTAAYAFLPAGYTEWGV